jgi:hypothetical protein
VQGRCHGLTKQIWAHTEPAHLPVGPALGKWCYLGEELSDSEDISTLPISTQYSHTGYASNCSSQLCNGTSCASPSY